MRQSIQTKEFFQKNRERLAHLMQADTVCVLFSNDMMPRNGDQYFPFRQNSDLYYLTGIDQEETILLLFPDSPLKQLREVLFLRKADAKTAVWEGHKYSKAEAGEISGIEEVMWVDSWPDVIKQVATLSPEFYLNQNEHWGAGEDSFSRQMIEGKKLKERFPFHRFSRLAPLMKELRLIKQYSEIEVIQKACTITHNAFEHVLKMVKPGLKEYEIEAEITYHFLKAGATGHAYAPIVASGKNATILHYTDNQDEVNDGDLILFDIGCEYQHYASDMSRTIPANGKFSKRQREVYNAVLEVFKAARAMIRPGVTIDEINRKVENLLMKKHIELGLYTTEDIRDDEKARALVKNYYPHGTSHFMGLDVHDTGTKYERLEAGMVLSCEPGIYIQEEKMGIRLENDILVTLDGPVDLMKDIPIEADEIEQLMQA
ncbi:MAG: aminopeptidase P family protein [Bacteroidales bacterium]